MYRQLVSALLLVAVSLAGVSAPAAAAGTVSFTCDGETHEVPIEDAVAGYNDNTDVVPSAISGALATNTTELQIRNADQVYYTVRMNDSLAITDVERGPASDADVIVVTDRETVCSIYSAENPAAAFQTAYENGEIQIEGQGLVDRAKVFVIERVVEGADLIGRTLDGLF